MGLKTTEVDSVIKLTAPPFVEFPNQTWLTTDIKSAERSFDIIYGILGFSAEGKVRCIPLRQVETKQINPTRTVVSLETLKIKPYTFSAADFRVPNDYKRTDADSDVFDLGL
jgi:hypothetical protein